MDLVDMTILNGVYQTNLQLGGPRCRIWIWDMNILEWGIMRLVHIKSDHKKETALALAGQRTCSYYNYPKWCPRKIDYMCRYVWIILQETGEMCRLDRPFLGSHFLDDHPQGHLLRHEKHLGEFVGTYTTQVINWLLPPLTDELWISYTAQVIWLYRVNVDSLQTGT